VGSIGLIPHSAGHAKDAAARLLGEQPRTTIGRKPPNFKLRHYRTSKELAPKHAGVIAWSREARPDVGEYGEPTTLFLSGDGSLDLRQFVDQFSIGRFGPQPLERCE